MLRALFAVCVVALVACGSAQSETTEPTEAVATPTPAPATGDAVEGSEQAVEETPAPEGDAPRGRMAFTQCTDPRAEMCTKEYRPVCGVVDTGVRCVAAPCEGATEQRNFGNACMACADAKTTGYWPVACEELGNDAR